MSAASPLVSIVIPAYNAADYLATAIDSVLAQDYPHLELLVLDDGSTDATPEVLSRYTGRIRHDRQSNVGQAATLNRGWAMSSGELIGYLSADDVLLPHAVSTAVRALQADPDLVLVYPDYGLIDPSGRPLRRVRAPEYDYREVVVSWVCPPGPGALFRRSAASAAGPWDPALRLIPDYDFWLRLGLQGPGARIPEVLACFRVHEGSQSFRPVPPVRSEEYQQVTASFFGRPDVPAGLRCARREALSNAYLFSARSHLRSGRYATGLARAWTALRLHPQNLTPYAGKILAHGLVHPLRYRRAVTVR